MKEPDYNLFKQRISVQEQDRRYWWMKRTFLIYKILRTLSALAVLLLVIYSLRAVVDLRSQRKLLESDKTAVIAAGGNTAFYADEKELNVSTGGELPPNFTLLSSDGTAEIQLCHGVRVLFQGAFQAEFFTISPRSGTQKTIRIHLNEGAFSAAKSALPKGVSILFTTAASIVPWDGNEIKISLEKEGFQTRITGEAIILPRSIFNLNLDNNDLAQGRLMLDRLKQVRISSSAAESALIPRFVTVNPADYEVLKQIYSLKQFDDVVRRLFFSGSAIP